MVWEARKTGSTQKEVKGRSQEGGEIEEKRVLKLTLDLRTR